MRLHTGNGYGRGTEFGVVNGTVLGAVNGAVRCGDRRGQRGQSDGRAGEAHLTAFGKRTTFGIRTALGRCTLLVDRAECFCVDRMFVLYCPSKDTHNCLDRITT